MTMKLRKNRLLSYLAVLSPMLICAANALATASFTVTITAGQSPSPVCAGSSATYTVQVTSGGNPSSDTVTLSASNLPGAVTAGFSPSTFTFTGNNSQSSQMTLTTPSALAGGTYSGLTLTATPQTGSPG